MQPDATAQPGPMRSAYNARYPGMTISPRYVFGEFELDAGTFQLRRGSDVVAIEPKGLDVLRLLLDRAPSVVDKAEIFAVVWKDVAVTDNALTRVVALLR